MNVGFQIDEIHQLNPKTDSTLPLILESQKRGNKNFVYIPSSLTFKNDDVYATVQQINFKTNNLYSYKLGNAKTTKLSKFQLVFIRQDPPYNMRYLSSLHLLEQVKSNIRFINHPSGIRNAPEKISMLKYQKITPPTIITRSKQEVDDFMIKNKKSIIKPLYGNGGESVFLLKRNDKNYNQILEKFIIEQNEPFIVQKFIPEVKNGDKRIIIVDGDPIAAIRRIPKKNEIRSNLHVGGNSKPVALSKNDKKICALIRDFLIDEKLFFVGIDVIGNYLTEINVTSPTCIQEIKRLQGIDIAEVIWDKL